MKAMVYLAALAVGGAVGAAGMGVYNVKVGGYTLEEPVDSTLLAMDDSASAEIGQETPDSLTVDPTLAQGESEDSTQVAAADTSTASAAALPATPPAVVQNEPPQVAPPDPDSIARAQLNYQRLARIFAAMKPDQAAPVLAQLDDEQLQGILMSMQGRNAAPILAAMDPERVAAISRTVLRGNE